MIIDNIQNAALYESLNPHFKQAFDYLKSLDFSQLEVGRTELDGDNLFVMVSEPSLKTVDAARLEVHNAYIDIQVPVSRVEKFGWSARSEMQKPVSDFDAERDCQLFEDKPEMYFELHPGNFAIFFPEDAHAPCIGEGPILKMIFKVKTA